MIANSIELESVVVPAVAAAAAEAVGLPIPEPCAPGVAANLALLSSHAERMRRKAS